jgi:hypothetical protein
MQVLVCTFPASLAPPHAPPPVAITPSCSSVQARTKPPPWMGFSVVPNNDAGCVGTAPKPPKALPAAPWRLEPVLSYAIQGIQYSVMLFAIQAWNHSDSVRRNLSCTHAGQLLNSCILGSSRSSPCTAFLIFMEVVI